MESATTVVLAATARTLTREGDCVRHERVGWCRQTVTSRRVTPRSTTRGSNSGVSLTGARSGKRRTIRGIAIWPSSLGSSSPRPPRRAAGSAASAAPTGRTAAPPRRGWRRARRSSAATPTDRGGGTARPGHCRSGSWSSRGRRRTSPSARRHVGTTRVVGPRIGQRHVVSPDVATVVVDVARILPAGCRRVNVADGTPCDTSRPGYEVPGTA